VRDTVAGFDYGVGWYPPEGGRRRRWTWTSGDGVLSVPPGRQRLVRADFGRPGAPGPVDLTLTDEDGQELTSFEVTPHFRAHVLNLGPAARGTELHLRSDTFTPGGSDIRELGVAMSRARLAGTRAGPRRYVALRFPWLRMDPDDLAFLTSYDVVMANSQYTRGWIRRLWDRDADVLYPPIQTARLTPAPERDRTVVTVGRFFAPGLGHAKRQLEMVRWFGDLYRSGHLPGWRMHVAGGCEASQLPYLAAVRAAAEGLPVEIHPNAPRKEVERLLSTASIFWSATGYGEDERRPWAAEHFGMTTVEAMAGGCVPVVIDRAGHREIVRAGLDGFRWRTPAELSDLTVRVARDGEERARLATAAAERARQFSDEAFATRWADIVARHHLLEE
jgi:glycosyltransferase involved in cell wall biosynthesis